MKADGQTISVKVICWLLAAAAVWELASLAPIAAKPTFRRPVASRVRVAHAPVKTAAASREQLRVPAPVAPAKKAIVKTVKPVKAPPPVIAEKTEPDPPIEKTEKIPLVAIEQPGLEGTPPAPPDDMPLPTHFDDKPGGSVLVLALNLNSDNKVIATDILVQSSSPLNDLAFSMSSFGVIWKNVDPPIPPGQFRWIEVRVDYDSEKNNAGILP